MQIEFDLRVSGDEHADPYLDLSDVEMLFQATRADLHHAIERKLAGVRCVEHDTGPVVRVTVSYDRDTEQMDVSYNVETCCQPFLLRVVQILHRIG
jgi:acetaldehyde dehydrogenase (acetylating)